MVYDYHIKYLNYTNNIPAQFFSLCVSLNETSHNQHNYLLYYLPSAIDPFTLSTFLPLIYRFIFQAERWLAIEKDDGLIESVFPVSKSENYNVFKKRFVLNAKENLAGASKTNLCDIFNIGIF